MSATLMACLPHPHQVRQPRLCAERKLLRKGPFGGLLSVGSSACNSSAQASTFSCGAAAQLDPLVKEIALGLQSSDPAVLHRSRLAVGKLRSVLARGVRAPLQAEAGTRALKLLTYLVALLEANRKGQQLKGTPSASAVQPMLARSAQAAMQPGHAGLAAVRSVPNPQPAAACLGAPPAKRVRVGAAPMPCVVTSGRSPASPILSGGPPGGSRIANITLLVQPCGRPSPALRSGGSGGAAERESCPEAMQVDAPPLAASADGKKGIAGLDVSAQNPNRMSFVAAEPEGPSCASPFMAQCTAPYAETPVLELAAVAAAPVQAAAAGQLPGAKRSWRGKIITRARSYPGASPACAPYPDPTLPPASKSAPPHARFNVIQRLADMAAMPPPPPRRPSACGRVPYHNPDETLIRRAASAEASLCAAGGEGRAAGEPEVSAANNLLLLQAGECGAFARVISSHAVGGGGSGGGAYEGPNVLQARAAVNRFLRHRVGLEKARVFSELDSEVGAVVTRRLLARVAPVRQRSGPLPRSD